MDVVRRSAVGAGVLAGVLLVAGPVWAQEDPCAPGPDGSVPEMCQSGPAEPGAGAGGGAEDPCPPQPVEEGDGVVSDEGVASEPAAEPESAGEPEPRPEPAPEEELVDPPADGTDDGVMCMFGVPVAADGAEPVLESAPGGGIAAGGSLPRTGPYDQLLALTAIGSGLVLVGAGAAAAGRRRSSTT